MYSFYISVPVSFDIHLFQIHMLLIMLDNCRDTTSHRNEYYLSLLNLHSVEDVFDEPFLMNLIKIKSPLQISV
jgi:hypothetical protein